MAKQNEYKVGQAYKVPLNLLLLPDVELTARFSVGVNFAMVKHDIEAHGQLMPCGAQVLSDDERKANPGKQLLLTEGLFGRYKIAEILGRDLEVLIHAPKTGREILGRYVRSNGPRSSMSPMDISVAANRLIKAGYSEEEACIELAWVAGRGKDKLHMQRFIQYVALLKYPADVQLMIHDGRIRPDAALQQTNRKLTEDQSKRMVEQALERRKRELHEEWERDKAYVERHTDQVVQAAMRGELPPEPPAPAKRTRAKREGDPLGSQELDQAAKEVLGIAGDDKREDPAKAMAAAEALALSLKGGLLPHEGIFAATKKLRDIGGPVEEAADAIDALIQRKINDDDFCKIMRALIIDHSPTASRDRREVRGKQGKAPQLIS